MLERNNQASNRNYLKTEERTDTQTYYLVSANVHVSKIALSCEMLKN